MYEYNQEINSKRVIKKICLRYREMKEIIIFKEDI